MTDDELGEAHVDTLVLVRHVEHVPELDRDALDPRHVGKARTTVAGTCMSRSVGGSGQLKCVLTMSAPSG